MKAAKVKNRGIPKAARLVLTLSVLNLAAPAVAFAQPAPVQPASDPPVVPPALGSAVPSPNNPLAVEEGQLDRVRELYDGARRIFGGSHVLLSAILQTGQVCVETGRSAGNVFRCAGVRRSSGLAGLVLVPLFGWGGGHNRHWYRPDWWPVVQTDRAEEGYARFETQFRDLRDQMAGHLDLEPNANASGAVLARRFERLSTAFESVLARYSADHEDSAFYKDVERLKGCLGDLQNAPTLPEARREQASTPLEACGRAVHEPEAAVAGWTLAQKLRLLRRLWREFDLLSDAQPLRRHNLLIGPLSAIPITEGAGTILYGVGMELGTRDSFRLTLGGGLRSSMGGPNYQLGFDAAGWWAGVGLSGELSDGLINAAFGAQAYFGPKQEGQ
jgi:hypothetical protein